MLGVDCLKAWGLGLWVSRALSPQVSVSCWFRQELFCGWDVNKKTETFKHAAFRNPRTCEILVFMTSSGTLRHGIRGLLRLWALGLGT